jgi:hypothetical protein
LCRGGVSGGLATTSHGRPARKRCAPPCCCCLPTPWAVRARCACTAMAACVPRYAKPRSNLRARADQPCVRATIFHVLGGRARAAVITGPSLRAAAGSRREARGHRIHRRLGRLMEEGDLPARSWDVQLATRGPRASDRGAGARGARDARGRRRAVQAADGHRGAVPRRVEPPRPAFRIFAACAACPRRLLPVHAGSCAAAAHPPARPRALSHPQDWRFWVAGLAVLSVATALVGHTPSGDQTYAI